MQVAEIQAHLRKLQELDQIVGAMRSLASMRLQESLRSLGSARRYAHTIERTMHQAQRLVQESQSPRPRRDSLLRVLIVCASEQGFVGAFNDRLIEALETTLGDSDRLFVLGSRGAGLIRERGRRLHWSGPMATRLASLPSLIRGVMAELYPLMAGKHIGQVQVLFACQRPGAVPDVERRSLLPLPAQQQTTPSARSAPLHQLATPLLLERLTGEYLYAGLVEAAVESMASENGARLMTMEAARDNVSRRIRQVERQAALASQEQTTTELLDLLIGQQAVQERASTDLPDPYCIRMPSIDTSRGEP